MTVPLFGGRAPSGCVPARAVLPAASTRWRIRRLKDCRIVIEAGELRPESPLRKACERAKTAVAIGCYPDDATSSRD